nr:hypothetical protein [uncultured Dyadobacter sp.]
MKATTTSSKAEEAILDESDVLGPLMTWTGPTSDEEVRKMSDWVMARKVQLEKEKAHSVNQTE